MFGCLAVYIEDKIVLILRDKREAISDNGVWLATTEEHHESLRREFGSRSRELYEVHYALPIVVENTLRYYREVSARHKAAAPQTVGGEVAARLAEVIAEAHALAAQPEIPAPVYSRRCEGCSLKPICMPQETAQMRKGRQGGDDLQALVTAALQENETATPKRRRSSAAAQQSPYQAPAPAP